MLSSKEVIAAKDMTHESLIDGTNSEHSPSQNTPAEAKLELRPTEHHLPQDKLDQEPQHAQVSAVKPTKQAATSSYSLSSHQLSTDSSCSSSSSQPAPCEPARSSKPSDSRHDTTTATSVQDDAPNQQVCYNKLLDDEIKSRLDRLNALSDLINSLEFQFDEANSLFRDTLKCSTDRLSTIARTLGDKSIKYGRVYHAAKVSVEQSQSDCLRACVLFEQANKDHQFARKAIKDAELKLKKVAEATENEVITLPDMQSTTNSIDLSKLTLNDTTCPGRLQSSASTSNLLSTSCDSSSSSSSSNMKTKNSESLNRLDSGSFREQNGHDEEKHNVGTSAESGHGANSVAELSEELNRAITKLVEAENKRGQSERQHLDRANKLIVAQENLIKLEREYGNSIRRSQLYFDEAKRFNARLNSVKGDICRISEEILAAKQAYARTLEELEQFSDGLHMKSISNASEIK